MKWPRGGVLGEEGAWAMITPRSSHEWWAISALVVR